MRKMFLILTAMAFVVAMAMPAAADWVPEDGWKMHYPQEPDVDSGWDVNATFPVSLADDFLCCETGWIKDIHWWGSWLGGMEGTITSFVLKIHADNPDPDPEDPSYWSMPGPILWEVEILPGDLAIVPLTSDPYWQGWSDQSILEILPNNHQEYYQYNYFLPEEKWCWQEEGEIYWLEITANVVEPTLFWGWKSTDSVWNDDAVWGIDPDYDWMELYEPGVEVLTNLFNVTVDNVGTFIAGGGTDFYGDGWYYYPDTEWWNIWFYDHPLDVERLKLIHIEFDASPFIPGPGLLEVAVNWSTDLWDTPGEPPLPGVDEELYIGRETIVLVEDMTELEHFSLDVILPNFNPEWVSIDVRGSNFIIESGSISHTCIAPESMDLAFVITGEAPPIPTLSEWGLIIFTLLMLGLITWTIIRRRKVATASV